MFKRERMQVGRFAFLTILLVIVLAVVGCEDSSDDIPTGPAETVDYLIHDGWSQLIAGRVNDAIVTFSMAANAEATNLEAYLGLGYAYARNDEFNRAQLNFDNTIALTRVLLEDEISPLDPAYADSLLAEAYAGKASTSLAALSYPDAIGNARQCEEIWATFANPTHRWLSGVSLRDVQLIEANAHYGAGQYNESVLIVDELMSGTFISDAQHISSTSETVTVTLLQDTGSTGIAALTISNFNLIHPVSVVNDAGTNAEITSFVSAGNSIRFRANPIPSQGDQFTTEYLYADDFGQFLIELREAIADLE